MAILGVNGEVPLLHATNRPEQHQELSSNFFFAGAALDFTAQPGAGEDLVTVGGAGRDAEDFGGPIARQAH
jgi:hypothetical protein